MFATFPQTVQKQLHGVGWKFYTGVSTPDESRLMCSWDTTPADVDAFVADVSRLMGTPEVVASR